MLEATSLECQRGDRRLFSGVDLRLEAGEVLHVAGENGCGKTSLLRMLCGFSPPVAGQIRWQGEPIGHLGEAYRREIFYLGHANAIKDELSPLENLLSAARRWRGWCITGRPCGFSTNPMWRSTRRRSASSST